jgi:excisionase family DNA binding protein
MKAGALNLPTEQDTTAAQTAIEALRNVGPLPDGTTLRFVPKDASKEVEVVVPAEAVHLLIRVLTHMANGHAVTVMPVQAELTTQQAADLLGVSRPYMVRLLEEGKLPFHKVGTHRRVRFVDLAEYRTKSRAKSKRLLDELTQEAQDLGLGY